MEYGSQIGYREGDDKTNDKNDGDEKKRGRRLITWYKHRTYVHIIGDNKKKKAHLTKFSKYCRFNGKSKYFIASER